MKMLWTILISVLLSTATLAYIEEDVLNEFYLACADTWCEGNYYLDFKEVSCLAAENHCEISFTMQAHDDHTCSQLHFVTCKLDGFESYDELLQSYYRPLSECIVQEESKLDLMLK